MTALSKFVAQHGPVVRTERQVWRNTLLGRPLNPVTSGFEINQRLMGGTAARFQVNYYADGFISVGRHGIGFVNR